LASECGCDADAMAMGWRWDADAAAGVVEYQAAVARALSLAKTLKDTKATVSATGAGPWRPLGGQEREQ
jgi:hypothetical protein